MMPALTSSSSYSSIAEMIALLGGLPASLAAVALIITITLIGVSPLRVVAGLRTRPVDLDPARPRLHDHVERNSGRSTAIIERILRGRRTRSTLRFFTAQLLDCDLQHPQVIELGGLVGHAD